MTKEELRAEYTRFINLKTLDDCKALAEIFLEHLWNVLTIHHEDEVFTQAHKDAKIINQMMFTKLLHLNKLLNGVDYTSASGDKLNKIIDPTIIASLVRNVFETTALFNLLFRQTSSEEEQNIIHKLWVIAGLNYRQKFGSVIHEPENQEKLTEEKKQIEDLIESIKTTTKYKSLTNSAQRKIENKINKKDYRITFDANNVKTYNSWQELCDVMELNKDLFEHIYTFFSLYSHPSNVSVFQFETMFDKESETYKSLTTLNFKYCFSFLSVFIADYIHLFPQVKETFEKLSIEKQIAINSLNKMLRGDKFSINDAWKELE